MILVHHLRVGRSVFTVWLLEEMGLDYELKIYDRGEDGRAPAELKQAHFMGKSPVIEMDGYTLAESGAIANYLCAHYDADNKLGPVNDSKQAHAEWLHWLHFSEGTAVTALMMQLLLIRSGEGATAPTIKGFADGETQLQFDYIAQQLGNKPYLLGDDLRAPDVGVGFVCQMAMTLGLLNNHPTLQAYVGRIAERSAFKAAMDKTGG